MTLVMDADELMAFLRRDFGQVAEEFAVERADADGVTLRLTVAERHLRPGGRRSSAWLMWRCIWRSCRGSGRWR
jgi:hypothetical protein